MVQSTSHMCLESHKHKGTTFQGTQISTHIPSMKHLVVFGSTYYALIPKEQRSKLDARSKKYIFLGYSYTTKGYLIYNETNKKFILSRDVTFLESTKKDEIVEKHLDHLERYTMNLMMRFHILKGGSMYWFNLWNLLMKHHLPLILNNFLPLHENLKFNWMM
jgi:hypothetical protein